MKQNHPRIGVKILCGLFGKTRHAYYDHWWRQEEQIVQQEIILQLVDQIRLTLPRIGTRKLHHMLESELMDHGIHVGRDYLFGLLSDYGLLIRQRKRNTITTNSRHWMKKYSNLIKELSIIRPEQVWVSDITYIRMFNRWGYLSLITDAYSHKIMGWAFRQDLTAQGCLDAIAMAFSNRIYNGLIIHHSDRGTQYCSKDYVDLLMSNSCAISMTEKGDPYENAIAERVNGIIKSEFNLHNSQLSFEQTKQQIEDSINAYNQIRPHSSCDFLTPNQAHLLNQPLKKRWKNYKKVIFENTTCIPISG